jgi:hypothetical protein
MTSNIVIDPITNNIVHFCIDFASRLLKQISLFPHPNGFLIRTDPRNENK